MLSVVIPTYRKPDLLARTLAALADDQAAVAGKLEVVVVDDGSGDSTSDVIQQFTRRLPLVEAGPAQNEGRARARNRGWRAASGRWVLFLDDDIVLDRGSLSAHLHAQESQPAAYLGDVVTAPEVIDSTLFDYLDTRGVAKLSEGAEAPARYFLTQNVSVPRDALQAVDGFDEEFGAYGFEDMEIAFRMEDATGLRYRRLAGARGQHIHHHSLDEYLAKKEICGRETLPQLAALHPHRIHEMRLHLVPGLAAAPDSGGGFVRQLVGSWSGPVGQGILKGLARAWPGSVWTAGRHRVYDALVLTAYARGLAKRASD